MLCMISWPSCKNKLSIFYSTILLELLPHNRGLHGGPETRGPGTRTGSGLYFKWSAGSGSGPNLLLRVPGLFNIPESIGEHRTREWSVSVSMRVFCNLQFVKLGWEKCEREIRWKKKHALPQPPETERGRSSTANGRWSWISSWVMWKKSWNKTEETHGHAPVIEHARSKV